MPRKSRQRKGANGDGSVYQRADGRWVASVSLGSIDGKRIRKTAYGLTRDAARDELRNLISRSIRGPVHRVTVGQVLNSWLYTEVKQARSENTYRSYKDEIDKRLYPALANIRISEFTPLHVNNFIDQLQNDKVGARTVENCYTVLSTAMKFAMRMGFITDNPCKPVPKPQRKPKEIRPFDAKQTKCIIKATANHRLHALFVLAFSTGMRQGELFGLRWEDVDLVAAEINIQWQVVEVRGKVKVARPKTKSSIRKISITKAAVRALKDRRRIAMKEGNAASELVFCGASGGYMRRSNFGKRVWRKLLERLKIKPHRGFHHARHTAATLMLSQTPVHIVARILGHSRPSITLDIYSHYLPSDLKSAADSIGRLLG